MRRHLVVLSLLLATLTWGGAPAHAAEARSFDPTGTYAGTTALIDLNCWGATTCTGHTIGERYDFATKVTLRRGVVRATWGNETLRGKVGDGRTFKASFTVKWSVHTTKYVIKAKNVTATSALITVVYGDRFTSGGIDSGYVMTYRGTLTRTK